MRGHDLDDDLALGFRWTFGIGTTVGTLSWILVTTVWRGLGEALIDQLIVGGGTLGGLLLGAHIGLQRVRARYHREGIDV